MNVEVITSKPPPLKSNPYPPLSPTLPLPLSRTNKKNVHNNALQPPLEQNPLPQQRPLPRSNARSHRFHYRTVRRITS